MTQDEIIHSPIGREQLVALAREAAHPFHLESELAIAWWRDNFLPKFAALVAAHEREKQPDMFNEGYQSAKEMYQTELNLAVTAAILAEREACAKVCEELKATYELDGLNGTKSYHEVAAAIRSRCSQGSRNKK